MLLLMSMVLMLLLVVVVLMLFPLKDEHVDDADDEMPVRFHLSVTIVIAICC